MIDRAYLQKKREEYYNVWMEQMANANANHGAMLAIEQLLAEMDNEPEAGQSPASEG